MNGLLYLRILLRKFSSFATKFLIENY